MMASDVTTVSPKFRKAGGYLCRRYEHLTDLCPYNTLCMCCLAILVTIGPRDDWALMSMQTCARITTTSQGVIPLSNYLAFAGEPMSGDAAARIQKRKARTGDGGVKAGGYASRAQVEFPGIVAPFSTETRISLSVCILPLRLPTPSRINSALNDVCR